MKIETLTGPFLALALALATLSGCRSEIQPGGKCGLEDRCTEGNVCFDGDRVDHVCVPAAQAKAECPKSQRCSKYKFCRATTDDPKNGYQTCVK